MEAYKEKMWVRYCLLNSFLDFWFHPTSQLRFMGEVTSHEVAAATPTRSAEYDGVLKDLPNPLYDQCSTNTSRLAEYEVPHQQTEQPEALANPTYCMAEL